MNTNTGTKPTQDDIDELGYNLITERCNEFVDELIAELTNELEGVAGKGAFNDVWIDRIEVEVSEIVRLRMAVLKRNAEQGQA
jgi:hypothetical protein